LKTSDKEADTDSASMKFSDKGNAIIEMPENPSIDETPILDLSQFLPPTQEDREEVKAPVQELIDTLLKQNSPDTTHNLVSRFKELRSQFAIFDKNGNILGPRIINESHKPLVDCLDNLDTNIRWIIPVTNDSCSPASFHSIKSGIAKTDLTTLCNDQPRRQLEGETVSVKTVVMLPTREQSRVNLPNTDILTKTVLSHEGIINNKIEEPTIERVDNVNEDHKYEDGAFENPITFEISPSLKADYKSVLHTIIPGGVALMNDEHVGFSLDQMLSFYEPFLMYSDTISAKSEFYKEIRKRIHTNLKTYLDDYKHGKREMLLDTESVELSTSILLENIKTELLTRIKKEYRLQDRLSTSELLQRMNMVDNGRLYMSVMSYLMAYLYTPELSEIVIADEDQSSTASCRKRIVAKKYTSVEALQKDNGREEVYFDKEYDSTPYEILKKHAEAQKNMNSEEFLDYLTVVLKNEHKVDDADLAESLAKTIIMKKKPVEDGNYAMLVIYPKLKSRIDDLSNEEKDSVEIEADVKKRVTYFVRKHDNWITVPEDDVEVCKEECLFDKNSEFCNIVENTTDRIKQIAKKKLKQEMETTIQITMKDFEEELAKMFQSNEKRVSKLQKLQQYKDNLYTVRAYTMGAKMAQQEIETSPYESLRDEILSMPDFAKKQEYIVKFKTTFCREAVINGVLDESIHWYYCKKTNRKLLPAFLFKLAQSRDYAKQIGEIVESNGVIVDGAIVDKHSGYLIQPILENGEKVEEADTKKKEEEAPKNVCFTVPTRGTDQFVVYTVAKALCNHFEIEFQDKIIAITLRLITEDISEVKYYSNKLNHKTPYHVWKMRNLILFTAAVTFIVIQTHISPVEKKCLEGFPLEDSENYSGLHCMISILDDLKNGVGEPWINIRKHTPEKFLKELTLVIKKHLLPDFKISQMLEGKRAVQAILDTRVNKKRWLLFQPPQENIEKMKNLAISPTLVSEINESIKTANKAQHNYLGAMYKKIIENTYAYIRDRNQPSLDLVKEFGEVYNEIKQLSVPPLLLSSSLKRQVVEEAHQATFSENNIYLAYMHYCNLQNDLPIPDDLITICQEKLMGLQTMGLEQAINVLEDNGKKQTSTTLAQLMSIVAQRNIVQIPEDEQPLSFTDIEPSDNQDLVVSHILSALLNKEKVDDLDDYLKHLNQKMLNNIKEYLNLFGRDLSRAAKKAIANHLDKIGDTKNLAIFIKNSLYYVMSSSSSSTFAKNSHISLLFEEIRKDPIVKDIVFLVSQMVTITALNPDTVKNIYKYCYLSLFSQIISESKDDKYVKYKIENLFDGNEVDFVDDRHDFYNDVSSSIRDIVEKDIKEIEMMSQVYVAPVAMRCVKKNEPKIEDFYFEESEESEEDWK
jgi:hypothetical protein